MESHEKSCDNSSQTVSITLNVYDVHKLLRELERSQAICNISSDDSIDLYEKIASQLSGTYFVFHGSKKHRKADPEYFKKLEEKQTAAMIDNLNKNTQKLNDIAKEYKPWWKKFF